MLKQVYHYRTRTGALGTYASDDASSHRLQRAFNAIAEKMIKDGWLKGPVGDRVRYEGKLASGGKAIAQGGLVVATQAFPAHFEIRF